MSCGTTIPPKKDSQDVDSQDAGDKSILIPRTHFLILVYEPSVTHEDSATIKDKSTWDSIDDSSRAEDHTLNTRN